MTRKIETMKPGSAASNQTSRPVAIIVKTLILFALFNLVFAWTGIGVSGKLSLYNHIFPGRLRLPFGENPGEAYNFSLDNLDAMFASHILAGSKKPADEFRVIVIGDSSTWGILLHPEETLAGLLDSKGLDCSGKKIRAYNLGYPTLSLTKDLLILDRAMDYQPDLIIWPVTLESFPEDKQLTSPLVQNNQVSLIALSDKFDLNLKVPSSPTTFLQKTIVGQRKSLADLIRLQLYGSMWAATGIDQVYPLDYQKAQTDLKNDQAFHSWMPPEMPIDQLAFYALMDGLKIAGNVPVLMVNEPILISQGTNSDIRYNFYYPIWAYDQYRKLMQSYTHENSINYLDLWNIIPPSEFTNSAIHLTPSGEKLYASSLSAWVEATFCR